MRLYDVLAGKDVWEKEFPSGSFLAGSIDVRLAVVLHPKGTATLIDVPTGREIIVLPINPVHLKDVMTATLLHDRDHYYLALAADMVRESAAPPLQPLFQGELSSIPVNGRLYAFRRDTGKVRGT